MNWANERDVEADEDEEPADAGPSFSSYILPVIFGHQ